MKAFINIVVVGEITYEQFLVATKYYSITCINPLPDDKF